MNRILLGMALLSCVVAGAHGAAPNELSILSSFDPSMENQVCSIGYDEIRESVWVHGCGALDVSRYSRAGDFLDSVPRPGEGTNDVDLDFAPEGLVLAGTFVPEGTLLFINGEIDEAEIYAVDPVAGTVIETLETSFGVSHVVGGAYHATRDTFFLVQDKVPPGTADDSIVAEIDPSDGSVLDTFKVDDILMEFTVDFGDLEVNNVTGNLLIVSSDETTIAEFTPTGEFVRELVYPPEVTALNGRGLSGIALDDTRREAWVTDITQDESVTRLGGPDLYPWFELFIGDAVDTAPEGPRPLTDPRTLLSRRRSPRAEVSDVASTR